MTPATRTGLRVSTQALLLQLGVLVVVLAAGLGLVSLLLRSELDGQFEKRALAIAHAVAADPQYAAAVTSGPPSVTGEAQQRAEQVRERTGALFVVVTDGRGVRYSHPNPALVGGVVSTDPSGALSGRDVVALERGTLGLSARGKTPLRDASGAVVGEVSVGLDARDVHTRLVRLLEGTAGFGAVALVLGAAGAVLLARRLKRQTLGLEPAQLAGLVVEHEAVLHGVRDGVVALDARGRVRMVNGEARTLLAEVEVGDDLRAHPRLAALAEGPDTDEQIVLTDDRTLAVTVRRVQRDGRDLGTVLTLRDRTQLEHLGRELETVRALFDALRAQSHEHTNRLHALAGMLHLGHVEQARSYLDDLALDPLTAGDENGPVRDAYLRGLLAAKAAAAAERGVHLRLAEDCVLDGELNAPIDVVTVVGNLLDNAVRAAAEGARRPAWVEVLLAADDATLSVAVTDSGDGLPENGRHVFDDGWTTRSPDGGAHGLGLPLARQTARRHGGDVVVLATGGADHGAVVAATLHDVVTPARTLLA